MKIKDVLDRIVNLPYIIVPLDYPIEKVVEKLLKNPQVREIYVVDEQNRLVGEISLGKIIRFLCTDRKNSLYCSRNLLASLTCEKVSDIMDEAIFYAKKSDDLDIIIDGMVSRNIKEIPVVDDSGRIIANVGVLDLWRLAKRQWRCRCS